MKKLLLLLILFSSPVFGATYFVNKSGSNANSCATAQSTAIANTGANTNAKLTVAAGLACMTTSDTLDIGPGTYAESISSTNCATIPCGTSSAYTTIRAATSAQRASKKTTHTAGDIFMAPSSGDAFAFHGNNSYITFNGISFDGVNHSSTVWPGCCGVTFDGVGGENNHHIEVLNGQFKNNKCGGGIGSGGAGAMEDIVFTGNYIHGDTCDTFSHHIYAYAPTRWTIEDNWFETATDYGVQMYPGPCYSNIVRRNMFYNNGAGSCGGGGCAGSGMNTYCEGDTIFNNVFWNNDNAGIVTRGYDFTVYNNTAYGQPLIYQDAGDPPSCINNLVVGDSLASVGSCSPSTTNVTTGTAASHFTDAGSGDFTLVSGSTAIDTGTSLSSSFTYDYDLNNRPLGSGWDVGAFEYETTTPAGAGISIFRSKVIQ